MYVTSVARHAVLAIKQLCVATVGGLRLCREHESQPSVNFDFFNLVFSFFKEICFWIFEGGIKIVRLGFIVLDVVVAFVYLDKD